MNPEYVLTKPYGKGAYNEIEGGKQWIRLTEGCPHKHPYCAESFENPELKVYEIPEIKRNEVNILDMNLLCHKEALEVIKTLGQLRVNNKVIYYSLQCGIDFRYLTQEIASALKQSRFKCIRIAWDLGYNEAYAIYDTYKLLLYAGYKPKDMQVFMLCNWKIPYSECCLKLNTLKIWNIQVSDCWFDNQLPPNIKPIHWKEEEIKEFRHRCRDHNIMIRHNGMQIEKLKNKEK
jgi:hypothetical protein